MSTSYKIITPPAAADEPLTLNDLRTLNDASGWLRGVNWTDEDDLLKALISRARSWAETVTHRALATQIVQQVETIERPTGGELSGPIDRGPSWYQYQEQLGANPFGAAQFYFDLALPPFQSGSDYTLETKITAFDPWTIFPLVTNGDGSTSTYVDDNREPARLYVQSPVTANFWRLTYTAGYNVTYPIPPDLKQLLVETVAFFYENREASVPPDGFVMRALAKRVDWL
jgi:hypothetical protein